MNLFHVTCREGGMRIWVQRFGDSAPLKFGRAKSVRNLVRLRTTSDFDREYLQNESRYRRAENDVTFGGKDLVNFVSLTTKFSCLTSAHPKSTVRAISDNFELRSPYLRNGSRYRQRDGVINYNPSRVRQKMVSFGPLTTKFPCLISTHPISPLRVVCRLMRYYIRDT